jgi:hypothetical protein
MAYQFAVKNGINIHLSRMEWKWEGWIDHHLPRHKEALFIRKPYGTSFARANSFNRENMNMISSILEEEYETRNYSLDRMLKRGVLLHKAKFL